MIGMCIPIAYDSFHQKKRRKIFKLCFSGRLISEGKLAIRTRQCFKMGEKVGRE